MIDGLVTMSMRELGRINLIRKVAEQGLKQSVVMRELGLSKRQVIRLVKAFRAGGEKALVSKRRGKIGNRSRGPEYKAEVKKIVEQHYADFGPTFAAEKLEQLNTLKINKETLRQWMIEWGLWKSKPKRIERHQQSRDRRSSFGELVQIDGSPHDWFEGRREDCCLLVLIDDATSRLVGLRFEEQETTEGYFKLCRSYIEIYGRPLAFYSDKFGVFRVNTPGLENTQTQFGRAVADLGIELIFAHSPEAKGRVERANKTLQDRLIKEMRLRGISTIEEANAYLPEFIADHNQRFAVEPRNSIDAHKKDLPVVDILDLIFSFQEERVISKQLEISYNNRTLQIDHVGHGYRLRHKKVKVCEDMQGVLRIFYAGTILTFKEHAKQQRPHVKPLDRKGLHQKLNQLQLHRKKHIPKLDHPWRGYFKGGVEKMGEAL
jgi:transposase